MNNTILFWADLTKTKYSSEILDVGCGNGDILYEFKKHGFSKLSGVDPFPPKKDSLTDGIKLSKGDVFSIKDLKFDLIMFHHSFEHMNNHEEILKHAITLLKKNGKLLIRMPIINEAFYTYKSNWVQIDAPRHIIIHSLKSFTLLAEKLNLEICEVFFDSTPFQFLGSEQNLKDISFFEPNSYKIAPEKSIFSKNDFEKYDRLSKEYNSNKKGDQAGFVLKLK